MATTTPDNIWTPDAGDDYALTTDLARTADDVQDALLARSLFRIGTVAERDAWAASNGARFVDSSTGNTYSRISSSWVLSDTPKTTFTPAFANMVVGTTGSSVTAFYKVTNGILYGRIAVTLGSGFAFNTSAVTFDPPVTPADLAVNAPVGLASYLDNGLGWSDGVVLYIGGKLQPRARTSGGVYSAGVTASGNPFGFSTGDQLHFTFSYPVVSA